MPLAGRLDEFAHALGELHLKGLACQVLQQKTSAAGFEKLPMSNKSAIRFNDLGCTAHATRTIVKPECSRLEQWRCCVVTNRGCICLVGVLLGLLLSLSHVQAATTQVSCAPIAWLNLQAVLPGVAVVHGQWPAVEVATSGGTRAEHLATTVVLGHGSEVTVVDPGPSRRTGLALKNTLRCKQGAVVSGLINTHAHAEQVLANSAFRAPVKSLAGTAQAMKKRCPQCLATLRRDLGEQALKGTRIVVPGVMLKEGQTLKVDGRVWQVLEMLNAHTENDLVLWSRGRANLKEARSTDGVVLVGGLVDGRWPVLSQGSVVGWLGALDRLQAMQPYWLIGQHVVAEPEQVFALLQRQRGYLCGLLSHAWQKLEEGQSEAEAVQGLAVPAQWPTPSATQAQAWHQQHTFNQLRAWREAEQLWLTNQDWPVQCGLAPNIAR